MIGLDFIVSTEKSLQHFKQEKYFNMIINNIANNNCYHLALKKYFMVC